MAENDPIVQRISVDAEKAIRDVNRFASAEAELSKEVDEQTRATERLAAATDSASNARGKRAVEVHELTKETDRLKRAEGELQESTEKVDSSMRKGAAGASLKGRAFAALADGTYSLLMRLTGLTAVLGAVVQLYKDVSTAAKEAAGAIAQTGEASRALSANIGGQEAATVFRGVTAIAAANRFNVQGRAELLEGVAALTDVRTDASMPEILQSAQNLALLQRATGKGGKEGFQTIQSLQANLGVNEAKAVDMATALLNSGVEAQAIQDIVERGGAYGGQDLLAAMLAARKTGLNVNRAGRSIPTLVGSLTARNDEGQLTEELQQAGITEDMTIIQRMQQIQTRVQQRRMTPGQAEKLLGGAESGRLVVPLLRAVQDESLFKQAQAELDDANAAESTIERLRANQYVRAQERQNLRELMVQAEKESSTRLGRMGEELLQQEAVTANATTIEKFTGYIGNIPNTLRPTDAEADAARNEGRILEWMGEDRTPQPKGQAYPPQPVQQTVINIGNQYNAGEPRLIANTGRRE